MKIPIAKMSLVAFDPGESTGIVLIEKGKLLESETLSVEELENALLNKKWTSYDKWVAEDFILYPWAAEQIGFNKMIPARIIGMLQLATKQSGISLTLLNAGVVKHFSTDSKLNHLGWLGKLRNKHEKDAARHALYFLIKKCVLG